MTTPTAAVVGDRSAARRWLDERVAEGCRRRDLPDLPPAPWDLHDRGWATCAEPVDAEEVADGVLAVLRGVAVAFVVPEDRAVAELLGDELRRVLRTPAPGATAPVDPTAPAATSRASGPAAAVLDPDTLELLAVLAGGASTAEAAATVHISLRTAERRLTAARRTLGVRSTAEAVRLVVSRGR